ncbi:MAG: hypothetical protein Q9227_000405 [Pyrenula ochraceoflavens]
MPQFRSLKQPLGIRWKAEPFRSADPDDQGSVHSCNKHPAESVSASLDFETSTSVQDDSESYYSFEDHSNTLRSLPHKSRITRTHCTPETKTSLDRMLMNAVNESDISLVGEALDKGADINAVRDDGFSALQVSLNEDHTGRTALLLLAYFETNIHYRNAAGGTPLHIAVRHKQLPVVSRLLARGARIEAYTNEGYSPLHMAVLKDVCTAYNDEILNLLLTTMELAKIEPDSVRCPFMGTALHVAVLEQNKFAVDQLLKAGCSPSILGFIGDAIVTPLYCAVEKGDGELVEQVITDGKDIDINGQHRMSTTCSSLYDLALSKGFTDLAIFFKAHGANWI